MTLPKHIYQRGNRLWCRLKDERGKWVSRNTGYVLGQEKEAADYAKAAQRILDAKRAAGIEPELAAKAVTVREYADRWLERRREAELDWKNDRARLKYHVFDIIGDLEITAVRTRHIVGLFHRIRTDKERPWHSEQSTTSTP